MFIIIRINNYKKKKNNLREPMEEKRVPMKHL